MKEVYSYIRHNAQRDLSNTFEDTIRRTIQSYSSDTTIFNGKVDLFYSVEGIGGGFWGLRNYNDTESTPLPLDIAGYPEGRKHMYTHLRRERNGLLIREAKKRFLQTHDRLYCEVCGLDFERIYGIIGSGFIEAHHIIPLSEMDDIKDSRIEDIVLLCSNCHSMIHRKRPWLSKGQLSELLAQNQQ